MRLGERIYKLRTEKNLSQGELADALNVSRQSVSKWETDASVPELDKLIKLGEIFGVSLDELVLDKKLPESVAAQIPKTVSTEPDQAHSGKKIIGTVLLCFAALVWLLVTLLGDIIAGLILAAPFAACGLICLLTRKYTGLWCTWVVYLFIEIYLRFATGVNWSFVFVPYVYTGGWTVHLIIAWALLITFAMLSVITALRLRKAFPGSVRSQTIGAVVSWVVYLLTWFVFLSPANAGEADRTYAMASRFVSSFSGWVRSMAFTVALVFTVRLLTVLWEKRKRK